MKLLLDTHAAIWTAADDRRLGSAVRQLLRGYQPEEVAISDITLLEIAMLFHKKRIELTVALDRYLCNLQSNFCVLAISGSIAAEAFALTLPQGDPFDRVIVATARHYGLRLATRDMGIAGSGLVETVW